MKKFELTYKPFGASAILIEWPSEISFEILQNVKIFSAQIQQNNIKSIVELNFVYNSLLVQYDNNTINYTKLKDGLKVIYKNIKTTTNFKSTIWEIPVCYTPKFGIDLDFLSANLKLSKEAIIELHSTTTYAVYGIGFLPGFLYLGGLPKQLHCKRRETPRLTIAEGAVAIGGSQTGIYPQESPGGWHIIGLTPLKLFDVSTNPPCTIQTGDFIKFKSISLKTFEELKSKKEGILLKLEND